MQDDLPGLGENVPGWHLAQYSTVLAPFTEEDVPEGQGVHLDGDVAPVKGWKVPAWQGWHELEPVEFV